MTNPIAPTESETIGFVGLGRMGMPMALNLHRAGLRVIVYNRTPGRSQPLQDAGAAVAPTLQRLAGEASTLITMVSDARAAEAVIGAALGHLRPGALVIDMSTIGPDMARALNDRCADHGVMFADAPVSGATPLAVRGELTAMVGAEPAVMPRLQGILAPMTRAVHHLGQPGSGAAMKVALNTMLAATNLAIAEALTLAAAAGIDRTRAYDLIADSAVASPYVAYKRDAFLRPDEAELTFSCRDIEKDLGLAAHAAAVLEVDLLQMAAARQQYARASDSGYADADLTRIVEMLSKGVTP